MIDPALIDLVNRDIDGELNSAEKARLQAALEKNQDLRRFCQEQKAIASQLNTLGELDPPSDLKERIMSGIESVTRQIPPDKTSLLPWLREKITKENSGLMIRYAAVFLIGFTLAILYVRTLQPTPDEDFSKILGTIGIENGKTDTPGIVTSHTMQNLKDRIDLFGQGKLIWIDFNLSSGHSVNIQLMYDQTALNFLVIKPSPEGQMAVEHQGRILSIRTGASFSVFFQKIKKGQTEFRFVIENEGQPAEQFDMNLRD